ncbi:hypothetical protein HDV04_004379 [Boothiomyces sp. JEL0838]|nr:hypothetical protein HDV04_004379 [Boothiomyces sp. JEL0838]
MIAKPNGYIIDCREKDEVAGGMIPTAKNISVNELEQALALPPAEFSQKYGFPKPSKTDQLVFHCRSGKRSTSACGIAESKGFENIKNYEGSWNDWISDK